MSRISIILLLIAPVLSYGQLNPQSKKITEKFFPDPEIEIPTPAFQKKKGFTTYDEMMNFLNGLAQEHSDLMSISFIGKSQKGRDIPMVKLLKNGGGDKLKVWFQGGLHGNEQGSTEGMLYLIHSILTNPDYSHFLDKLEIRIVPMANIDGYEKDNRDAANGLDLNRDQTKLLAPESVYLKKAFSDYQPHVAVDFHEYRPFRRNFTKIGAFGVTNGYDVMFLYSGNLNVPEKLRHYTKETFVKKAAEVLESNDLKTHDYFSESTVIGSIEFHQGSLNSRSSATSYALSNTISTLIEVRGVGLGKTSYIRRTNSTFLTAISYLQTSFDNVNKVKAILAESANDTKEAVVTSKSKISDQPLELIDLETLERKEFTVRLRDAWYTDETLSRTRPTAYMLMPGQSDLAEKLAILGLKVDTLETVKTIEVERYVVNEYQQDAEKYEDVNRQNVSTTLESTSKEFPAGTFIIWMNQARANLAIETLEPEAPNSFVNYDVLHTEQGAELPVYRYLKKEVF